MDYSKKTPTWNLGDLPMYELYRNLNKQTKSVVPVIITDGDYDEDDDDDDGLVFKFPPVRKPLKSPCKYIYCVPFARVSR